MQALLEAIERDNLVQMRKLLEKGVDLSRPIVIGEEYDLEEPDEIGILFYAIRNQASREAIELLLEYGANLNELDENGITTLDTAIKFRRRDIIDLCIEKGMSVNESTRRSGITPLMLASCFNDIDIARTLIEHGADINATDRSGMSPKDYARKLGQKKMLTFLEEQGGKHALYSDKA
jgi:ankyrin repeat protein